MSASFIPRWERDAVRVQAGLDTGGIAEKGLIHATTIKILIQRMLCLFFGFSGYVGVIDCTGSGQPQRSKVFDESSTRFQSTFNVRRVFRFLFKTICILELVENFL